ncbi:MULTISPECIES: biotin synthase BioB [Thermodesulfovibrio]|uniref:biotin synthase BioB n=1 Tax=Thermodesulfovibrio TaxID=28261 RepID=UPI0026080FCC|nr:biotin synthase BioB [Thermodesulfovibrio sp.]
MSHLIEEINKKSILKLFVEATSLREKYKGNKIELCAIVNAKSGLCSEDCVFCAQSSRYRTNTPVYPLIEKDEIIKKAKEAKEHGVKRFSIVISGRKPAKKELIKIADYIEELRKSGIHTCASLGLIEYDAISYLKDRGLERLHCNIETSERFFSKICTTHRFSDKLRTLEAAKSVGLSVCSGGVFGMGESWTDREEMAVFLKKHDVDSIPINFLTPIKGTPLENLKPLAPFEALKIIVLFRLVLPEKDIRVCGGRPLLGDFASWIFIAGANALMTGNYLTTTGRHYVDDLKFIEAHGLEVDSVVC